METPENCRSCMYIGTFRYFCRINCKDIEDASVKPDWCPLMDLPEKDNGDYTANTSDAGFADVMICIEMLKQMYMISDEKINKWIEKKQAREAERMEKYE